MTKVIAYIGVIGSGKNFYAKKMAEEYKTPAFVNFSDAIREYTWTILGWKPNSEEEYELFKQSDIILDTKNCPGAMKENMDKVRFKGREFLQRLGTDVMKDRNKDIWAEVWFERAGKIAAEGKHDIIICTDCRHEVEVSAVLDMQEYYGCNVQFIFCDYKSNKYELDDHDSERFARSLIGRFVDLEDITDEMRKYRNNLWRRP